MERMHYLCNVFFIVLDLRLTKVGVRRYSFFYVHNLNLLEKTSGTPRPGKALPLQTNLFFPSRWIEIWV